MDCLLGTVWFVGSCDVFLENGIVSSLNYGAFLAQSELSLNLVFILVKTQFPILLCVSLLLYIKFILFESVSHVVQAQNTKKQRTRYGHAAVSLGLLEGS